VTLDAVEQKGEEVLDREPSAFEETLSAIESDDLATIIYTSGTTGEPKGVMLTHNNFVSNVAAISKGLPIINNDRSLAVLPLSHIFERTVFYVLCSNGVAIHYCASFDQLASHLQEVKPTIMTAVPRLFEQVYHKIVKKGKPRVVGRRVCSTGRSMSVRSTGKRRIFTKKYRPLLPRNTRWQANLYSRNGATQSAEV
jgi:long-subunit acyl-CoA synthetase (AMP-forming)